MNDAAGGRAAAEQRLDAGKAASRSSSGALEGVLVVEYGERLGAAVCGSLLAQLGAEVALIERGGATADDASRTYKALDKRSVVVRPGVPADEALLAQLMGAADIVLMSSDVSPAPRYERAPHQIVCDVTAFGASGPLSGEPYSDALVQAVSGLADTTGDPQGAPTLIGFPFCEVSAGIYAAAATLVAYRVRRARGYGQAIDIALFDCAVGALSTFLPFHVIGKPVSRAANCHSLAAPWNAYRTRDGWVLICTATDEQWRRLCTLIGRPELGAESGYATNAERVAKRSGVDEVVAAWACQLTAAQCIERLSSIDIACGPILTLDQLAMEPNLAYRGMVRKVAQARTGREELVPASPLSSSRLGRSKREHVPVPDEDRRYLRSLIADRAIAGARRAADERALPLAGLRVIEIGQYTTAPLVARQLGALGAEVLKIEPPGGEGSRSWPPTQGDRGYFFAFSNSDKKSLEIDLRNANERERFRALLRTADVLVENLKPGSLARLGFGPDELAAISPRLVYCGISGFGARSAYPGRPAFDTVVQAMSGFMDLTRADGVPMKAGISAADIIGGELALLAILAALEVRDRCAEGHALDISMQDAAVWATGSMWNRRARTQAAVFVRCADGYVCMEQARPRALAGVAVSHDGANAIAHASRAALVAAAKRAGIAAAPVCSVSEVAQSDQARARELIIEKIGEDGRLWPLLNSPLRFELTPARVSRPIGELGEANEVLTRLSAPEP